MLEICFLVLSTWSCVTYTQPVVYNLAQKTINGKKFDRAEIYLSGPLFRNSFE